MRKQVVANDADKARNKVARRKLGKPATRPVAKHGIAAEPVMASSGAIIRQLVAVGSAFAVLSDLIAGSRRPALVPPYQTASKQPGGRTRRSRLARVRRTGTLKDVARFVLRPAKPKPVGRVVTAAAVGVGAYPFGLKPRFGASEMAGTFLLPLAAPKQEPISAATSGRQTETPAVASARLDVARVASEPSG